MATKLVLRNTTTNGITDTGDGIVYDMLKDSFGSAADTAVVNTAASGTEIQLTKTAGGSTVAWISGRVPAGGFTLTTGDISQWWRESNMNANAGGRYRVYRYQPGGTVTELGGGPFDDGIEFGTADTEMTWAGNHTDQAFSENDRILIRSFITNIGTMAGGHTCTMTFNAANAATGDSFFNIAETVTFKAENVTGPVGMATETDASLALGAARPVGIASETDTALALAGVVVGPVGLAVETDTALALGVARPADVSSEADASLALGVAMPAGLAAETDTALALQPVLTTPVGMAIEIDSAMALSAATQEPEAPSNEVVLLGGGPGRTKKRYDADSYMAMLLGPPIEVRIKRQLQNTIEEAVENNEPEPLVEKKIERVLSKELGIEYQQAYASSYAEIFMQMYMDAMRLEEERINESIAKKQEDETISAIASLILML